MPITALVTLSARARRGVQSLDQILERVGLEAEHRHDQGAIVTGTPRQLARLEAAGLRVKQLPDPHVITIGTHVVDIHRPPRVGKAWAIPANRKATWTHHLVQLAGPRTATWLHEIEATGAVVVEPISRYGLFVVARETALKAISKLPFVTWVGPFLPAYRLGPSLQERKGTLRYLGVAVYPETSADQVRQAIKEGGGTVLGESRQPAVHRGRYALLTVEIDAKRLPALAALPDVRWLEWSPPDQPTDERSAQIVAENLNAAAAPNTAPMVGYQAALATLGLTGAGVTVGVVDTGVDSHNNATMHADLAGRMAFFVDTTGGAVTNDQNGHGTHVAGIAVGNAAAGDTDPQGFLLGQGVAPGAQFGSINVISTGGALTDDLRVENCVNNGSQVMNNSWGAALAAGYTARSATFDQRVRDPDDGAAGLEFLVIVSAAGNSGPGAGTVLNPWEAKNPIIVGNSLTFRPGEGGTDDIRGMRASSSRGPAGDGRLLPTICAPGTDIVSARSTADTDPVTAGAQRPRTAYTDTGGTVHQNYTQMSGTSMATPHVAGLCALLIQWWRDRTGGRNPSPAMLKALLVNGAEDIAGGPDGAGGNLVNIPNNNQGWGRVSLENIVSQAPASDRGPRIFSDQRHAFSANAQEFTIQVAPVDPARPLRITLVWTDAAGAVGAAPALVNDLDLEVTELATGTLFRGNVFANGFSTAGGAADALNNVECVYIQAPAGVYEVTVVASNVAASARPDIATAWQDFALAIENGEVPGPAPVSVVPVIDRSGSMVGSGYVDITKTSSRQFVDLMSVDDQVAVVSFGTSATIEYPTGASPALVDITGQPIRDAANAEISGIAFGGCTFMGDGIEKARDLLAPATNARAIVLLSDGYDNKGCDQANPAKPSALDAVATLPAGLPVYTCAMGPASDQTLLEQIATTSGGRYYYMPTIDDLFEIYNYIRGQITGDAIIVNDSGTASTSRMAAFVDRCAEELTLTVAWADPALQFVADTPHTATDIAIRLRDPKGRLLHPHDSYFRRVVGTGYAVFEMQEPMPGQWHVEVSTVRAAHTRFTVGGFVRSPIQLTIAVNPNRLGPAGGPLGVTARVYDGRTPVVGIKADAKVVRPAKSIDDLLRVHRNQLRRVRPPKGRDQLPGLLGRLVTLRNLLVTKGQDDLFAHRVDQFTLTPQLNRDAPTAAPAAVTASPRDLAALVALPVGGATTVTQAAGPSVSVNLGGRVVDAKVAGSYNVIVTAAGFAPRCGSRFVRRGLISVLAR